MLDPRRPEPRALEIMRFDTTLYYHVGDEYSWPLFEEMRETVQLVDQLGYTGLWLAEYDESYEALDWLEFQIMIDSVLVGRATRWSRKCKGWPILAAPTSPCFSISRG